MSDVPMTPTEIASRPEAQCLMVNCRNRAPADEAFCAKHRQARRLCTADQLQALIDENARLSAFTRDYIEAWEAGTGTVYLIDVARAALSPNPD